MFWSLLESTGNTPTEQPPANSWMMYIVLGVVIVIFIVWMVFSGRKNKQRQKEYTEQLEAIRPGHKVKTAGGICGIVVEVCDDNTVILETGSETAGKSYIKMDKELIAQTDAKGPTQIAREAAEAAKKAEREAKAAEKNGRAAAPEAGLPEPSDDAFEDMAAPSAAETPAETPAETSEEISEEANK